MPYLNLKLCGDPSQETVALAAKCLTDLTAEILKKARELTAIAVEFVAPSESTRRGLRTDIMPAC